MTGFAKIFLHHRIMLAELPPLCQQLYGQAQIVVTGLLDLSRCLLSPLVHTGADNHRDWEFNHLEGCLEESELGR